MKYLKKKQKEILKQKKEEINGSKWPLFHVNKWFSQGDSIKFGDRSDLGTHLVV